MAACGRWQNSVLRLRLFFGAGSVAWILHDMLVSSPFACTANLSLNLWSLQALLRERRTPVAAAALPAAA